DRADAVGVPQIDADHGRPLVGERPRDLPTDAGRRTGDDHPLALETMAIHQAGSGRCGAAPATPRSPPLRDRSPTVATTAIDRSLPENARFVGASNICASGSSITTSTAPEGSIRTRPSGRYRVTQIAPSRSSATPSGSLPGSSATSSGGPADPSSLMGTRTTRCACDSTTTSASPSGTTRQPFGYAGTSSVKRSTRPSG